MRVMRQLLSALFFSICAAGGAAFAQTTSSRGAEKQDFSWKVWVNYGSSEDSFSALKVDEIRLLKNGNYSYVDVAYYAGYNSFFKVNGYYNVAQLAINCNDRTSALKTLQSYDLDGRLLGKPVDYEYPLAFTFPETKARIGLEAACRIQQSGVTVYDIGFPDLGAAIALFKKFKPPEK